MTPSASRSRSNSEPTSRPFLSAGPRLTQAPQPRFAGLLLPNAGSGNRYRPLDLLDSDARTCPKADPRPEWPPSKSLRAAPFDNTDRRLDGRERYVVGHNRLAEALEGERAKLFSCDASL
jgi:hypothetical protein